MKDTRQQIIELSKTVDLASISIRELARRLEIHPQSAKYHRDKLEEQGLLKLGRGLFSDNSIDTKILGDADLIRIPYLGMANCGPATHIAGSEPEGHLTISSKLLNYRSYKNLFALKASGDSMDNAEINGQPICDGDYVVVDGAFKQPKTGDYVVAIVHGLANIKRIQVEEDRLILLSESSDDYEPIFVHKDDESENLIAGKPVCVIKKPGIVINDSEGE